MLFLKPPAGDVISKEKELLIAAFLKVRLLPVTKIMTIKEMCVVIIYKGLISLFIQSIGKVPVSLQVQQPLYHKLTGTAGVLTSVL